MDYEKEIKKHQEAIKTLKNEMAEKNKVNYSQYIGKCYQTSNTSYVKILNVRDVLNNGDVYCDQIKTYMDDNSNLASVDNMVIDDIDAYTIKNREITETEFNGMFDKAIEIIKNTKI